MTSLGRIPSYIRRVYIHFGFPVSEWATRYELDRFLGRMSTRARRTYQLLSRCISTPAGNKERAHSRYYAKRLDA